jgi:hypothetical protein
MLRKLGLAVRVTIDAYNGFLYWTACIFVYGGELNAAINRRHDAQLMKQGDNKGASS